MQPPLRGSLVRLPRIVREAPRCLLASRASWLDPSCEPPTAKCNDERPDYRKKKSDLRDRSRGILRRACHLQEGPSDHTCNQTHDADDEEQESYPPKASVDLALCYR
jgi:hypothetical protein